MAGVQIKETVAHLFQSGQVYALLSFEGTFWKLISVSGINFNHLVGPMPDLHVPFLERRTTKMGMVRPYVGPTAVPAFGRENYAGFECIKLIEAVQIGFLLSKQFIGNHDGIRRLA